MRRDQEAAEARSGYLRPEVSIETPFDGDLSWGAAVALVDPTAGTRVELASPSTNLLDLLLTARIRPVDVVALADGLDIRQRHDLGRMFTAYAPVAYQPNNTATVRMRTLESDSALIDFGGFTLLLNPDLSGAGLAAVPAVTDVVMLTGLASAYTSAHRLFELRQRCGVVVVLDTRVGAMLDRGGFPTVILLARGASLELGPARLIALPDDPAVVLRIGGRGFLVAHDWTWERARGTRAGLVDATCVAGRTGAPGDRSWPVRDDPDGDRMELLAQRADQVGIG